MATLEVKALDDFQREMGGNAHKAKQDKRLNWQFKWQCERGNGTPFLADKLDFLQE